MYLYLNLKIMFRRKAYFMGLLANVDSSILNLKLDHNFSIHEINERDGRQRIQILEKIPAEQVYLKIYIDYPCINMDEHKVYFISNPFIMNIKIDEEKNTVEYGESLLKMLVENYLHKLFRKIRLFKEGDIRMPLAYYFYYEDDDPFLFSSGQRHRYVSHEPFRIQESEIPELNRFIQDIELPFNRSYLQLTFDNFEISYDIPQPALSFLALMVSMESLFNPGDYELRYRISRSTAVLLGKDKEDSKRIYKDMRDFYDIRSKIVHTGKTNELNDGDVPKLRFYVRESIKKINRINIGKEELLQLLHSYGFGDESKLISTPE